MKDLESLEGGQWITAAHTRLIDVVRSRMVHGHALLRVCQADAEVCRLAVECLRAEDPTRYGVDAIDWIKRETRYSVI